MKLLSVEETSKRLGIPQQAIRCGLRAGKYPFGVAFKTNEDNKSYTYQIFEPYVDRFEKTELSLLPKKQCRHADQMAALEMK